MKKLVPIFIAVLGLAIGMSIGQFTATGTDAPAESVHATENAQSENEQSNEDHSAGVEAEAEHGSEPTPVESAHGEVASEFEYVKLPQQFVIPVFKESKVAALIVISLSLEIAPTTNELVFSKEPKLRDVFLQVMFKHAQSGGFDGAFTTGQPISDFKNSLKQAAIDVLGEIVHDVLITDMVKQDN